jgi:predicted PurR-regulated permease PerM
MIVAADLTAPASAGIKPSSSNNAPTATAETAKPAEPGNGYRLLSLAGLTVVLVVLCVVLSVPFLPAITWGVALAIIAWPLHRWISRHVERPGLAAALSTLAVVVLILVPGMFVAYQLAREAAVQGLPPTNELRARMVTTPVLHEVVAWMDSMGIDIEAESRKFIATYTRDVTSLIQGSLASAVQFLVAVFILFYLFKDRGLFLFGLRDLLPLSPAESNRVLTRAADSVHANLYASLLTSLIDAVGGGLMFWYLGLPTPLLWAVVMFVMAILPIVGAGLVWLPAVAYFALNGQIQSALLLLTWGVATFVLVDTLLYIRLAGKRMRIHEVPAMIAFLGGLAVFGVSGMILGPAILAVTVAFLEVWRGRLAHTDTVLPVGAALFVPGDTSGACASP